MKTHITKKEKEIMRLEQDIQDVTAEYFSDFLDTRLSAIIHHRNQLKNYRNAIHVFNSLVDAESIDIDCLQKFKIPLNKEPQPVHRSGVEIIVHSGILKKDGNKEYHCYLSEDRIQDHAFVNRVQDEMLEEINHDQKYIIINSDNCSIQYKCAAHFDKLQKMPDQNITLFWSGIFCNLSGLWYCWT